MFIVVAALALAGCSAEATESPSAPASDVAAASKPALAESPVPAAIDWGIRHDEPEEGAPPEGDPSAGETENIEHPEPEEQAAPNRLLVDGENLEVRPGPNATLWHPTHTGSCSYRLSAQVTHLDSGLHPHGAGLVLGGTDIEGEDQAYTYFLVRSDRHFLIKTRAGKDTHDVVPWTEHAAVGPENQRGVTDNHLAVEVGAEHTRFLINGEEVHRAKTGSLPTDGRAGLRLVHDIHVRFGPLELEELEQ